MKKLYILALTLLVSLTALAQNGRSLYNKYSDLPGVEAVYISPAMFRLMGRIPDMQVEDDSVNLGPIIKTLSGLYILNIKEGSAATNLYDDVSRFIQKGEYELLMEAKDNGETMRLYTVGDEQVVNSLVMLARQGDETDFICVDGTMPREQLETLIAEAAKD